MRATETATVTVMIIAPRLMPTSAHCDSNEDETPRMCLEARARKKKNWTKINYSTTN